MANNKYSDESFTTKRNWRRVKSQLAKRDRKSYKNLLRTQVPLSDFLDDDENDAADYADIVATLSDEGEGDQEDDKSERGLPD